MTDILSHASEALLMAAGMFWQVGWSLVFGFILSAILQCVVSRQALTAALGRDGWREIALATAAGAASSSCSYASVAVSRSLFQKGAALIPSLAFVFASTNLVVELGIILYLLMGWQFMAGEWIGGIVLVVILTLLVKVTYPASLVEEARHHSDASGGHDHGGMVEADGPWWRKLAHAQTWIAIAQSFVMDWSMLWKDLLAGFLIAGALSAFVPDGVWQALFVKGASPWVQVPANALLGPIVAVLTFVCSIGNVPMAAVLWGAGVSFGGVLAFLYADLIVLPLLDVYRRYFGWKMAAYIAAVFYATMVAAALVMDIAFTVLGWVPQIRPDMHAEVVQFSLNYTFWLNLIFGLLTAALVILARRNPMHHH
ncbi:MAG: permease [Rhodopila sp.]|jgi:uncharacterized membrane protein YraQ (UPF0718 family)